LATENIEKYGQRAENNAQGQKPCGAISLEVAPFCHCAFLCWSQPFPDGNVNAITRRRPLGIEIQNYLGLKTGNLTTEPIL